MSEDEAISSEDVDTSVFDRSVVDRLLVIDIELIVVSDDGTTLEDCNSVLVFVLVVV